MMRALYFKQIFPARQIFEVKSQISDINPQNEKTEVNTFFSYADARSHLTAIRRGWLTTEFTKYVKHKSVLFRSSAGDYYRVPSRLEALTRLENAVNILPTLSNQRFFKTIVDSTSLLRAVLPHPKNPSTEDAQTTIMQLNAVANDELYDVHGLFKSKSRNEIYY